MTLSQRHHYIPEFLIKGFTGKDNKIAVYNKIDDKLEPIRKSPKQVFFEWNRNTFNINGEDTDFVEGLYQLVENQFAPIYNRIIGHTDSLKYSVQEIYHLIFFIGFIHWRVPDRDKEMSEFVKNATNKDLFFTVRNKKTNQEASQELYNRILNEPAFIEGSKIIMAIRDYLSTDLETKLNNWKIYYASGDVQLHLLGDNPVILREQNESNVLQTELIFPLSKGVTVFHTNGKAIKELSPEQVLKIDILTFLQSNKFVCGQNGDYLYTIAQLAKTYQNEKQIEILKEEVFKFFE